MDKVIIPREIVDQILEYFKKNIPEEACGILAGNDGLASANIPINNQYHSPVKFYMEPLELFQAFQYIDRNHLELLAIYHSHPNGPDYPSETDIKEFLYPGVATIIGFPENGGGWCLKAFIIYSDYYEEIKLVTHRHRNE